MKLGHQMKADVKIGALDLGECEVVPALDGTMTVKFEKGEKSLDELDAVFQEDPSVTITEGEEVTEYESRQLQAYRVEKGGRAEVSFLTFFEREEEPEIPVETRRESDDQEVETDVEEVEN